MFEKVSRSLKYDSNFFFDHRHIYIYIYIYMDTTTDHFTPLALRVRGNKDYVRTCKVPLEIGHRPDTPGKF